ncbi:histone acetyltransferase type B [Xylona heveae TC161]|uniref:Histone acetyltransferase type B catalytic subunit n=1 Tax=Xylona heveae (strain CBS 132557 / TC161) TaxID=1328760 RepID=A0A165G1R1_XYLHT|nr:histone acetyltransferase type B [Xylona heveae TC161]KZF21638.1 histone acetyltransferase type B [Xylona heveae TC161]
MEDLIQYLSDSNKAFQISLVQPGTDTPNEIATFHPEFTYPIFGEEEKIFGYQGLSIHFRLAAHNLRPNLEISYDKKFKPIGDAKAIDLNDALKEHVAPVAFEKTSDFNALLQSDETAKDFKPPGKLMHTYTRNGRTFEVWTGGLGDPALRTIISQVQTVVPLFIEGGSYIDMEDPEWSLKRWNVYLVYEKLSTPPTPTASRYSFIGYSTSYRCYIYTGPNDLPKPTTSRSKSRPQRLQPRAKSDFTLPTSDPFDPDTLPCRERISQFLILPPYHGEGHGSELYNAIYDHFLSDPLVKEITVEDPNESFDDMRDFCDLSRLRADGTFASIKINTSPASTPSGKSGTSRRNGVRVSSLLDGDLLEQQRLKHKIVARQWARLVEMYLLSLIPPSHRSTARLTRKGNAPDENDRAYYYWRLLVKHRLYKQNKDTLMQHDRLARVDKLEETLEGVIDEYTRLLKGAENRVSVAAAAASTTADETSQQPGMDKRERGKKRVIVEDDDEDEDEDEDAADEPAQKKPKT